MSANGLLHLLLEDEVRVEEYAALSSKAASDCDRVSASLLTVGRRDGVVPQITHAARSSCRNWATLSCTSGWPPCFREWSIVGGSDYGGPLENSEESPSLSRACEGNDGIQVFLSLTRGPCGTLGFQLDVWK